MIKTHRCKDYLEPTLKFFKIGSMIFHIHHCPICNKYFIIIDKNKQASREILELSLDENNKWYLKIKEEVISTEEQIKSIVSGISLCQWLGLKIVK